MIKISAVILTLNEERNILRCIESVKPLADEIIVMDSFSTDRTEEICRAAGVKFIQHKFAGYIEQKNWALDQAGFDYVLSLDADEEATAEMQQSVLAVKNNWQEDGYLFNRMTNYAGTWLKHGGVYPDRKLRLWNRTKGRWGGTNPHDEVKLSAGSKTRVLAGVLNHYSFDTPFDFYQQQEKFSTIAAKAMQSKGKKSSFGAALLRAHWRFLRDYFFKLGFLDGTAGYIVARTAAETTFSKYIKLAYLNKKSGC